MNQRLETHMNQNVFRFSGGEFAELIIERAEGAYVYGADRRPVLDFTSGQMSSILGHSHPEIVATIREAAAQLDHVHSSFLSTPVLALTEALNGLLPPSLCKVLPLSTGGESNEAALRMAKMATGGFEIVAFDRSWHGVTGGAGASTFNGARQGYGPTLSGAMALPTPDAYRSPFARDGRYDWQAELDFGFEMLDRQSVGRYAAVIAEPVLSSAGIIELPHGYLGALKRKCEERGMLLILDEAQTGLGRTGDMFAFEHEGVVPDILNLSKTLGAGLPLSATITSPEIEATCHERGYIFYTTHAADPLPAAVGAKVIEIIVRDALAARARELGTYMKGLLLDLQQRHEVIGDVRGRGLLLGVELVTDRHSKNPARELGLAVSRRCLELGASLNISRRSVANIFRIAPPLTVKREQIDTAIEILDTALGEHRS
ncbi:MAG: aspartate aminotransferase family protein [Gammaproteobacteria bacterium]|nr:aspartate aminotransferase family protein [Gammaproteobacteria bacterium]